MNIFGGGYGNETMQAPTAKVPLGQRRSLREQLTDQIAYHKAKVADLETAVGALTPDVEKALDALQRLSG